MSVWRRKAIELFPDLRVDIEDPDCTTYSLLMDLRFLLVKAHQANDENMLQSIYGYAAWCMNQRPKDLWNAAGVVFYEHLVDDNRTLEQIPTRLSNDIFSNVVGLFAWRMADDSFAQLVENYNKQNRTKHSTARATYSVVEK